MISVIGIAVVGLVLLYVFCFQYIENSLKKEQRMFGSITRLTPPLSNLEQYKTKQWRNKRAKILTAAKLRGSHYYSSKWAIYEVRGSEEHAAGEVFCIKTKQRLNELCLKEDS